MGLQQRNLGAQALIGRRVLIQLRQGKLGKLRGLESVQSFYPQLHRLPLRGKIQLRRLGAALERTSATVAKKGLPFAFSEIFTTRFAG